MPGPTWVRSPCARRARPSSLAPHPEAPGRSRRGRSESRSILSASSLPLPHAAHCCPAALRHTLRHMPTNQNCQGASANCVVGGTRSIVRAVSKLTSLRDAIARFVPDGASVCLGTGLEAVIPFAAGHELIRQGKRDLTLIGPISDMLFDQLIGAGCCRKVVAAWVGNVIAGLGHNYRRAVERGVPHPIEVEDHSNFTLALGLLAAPPARPRGPPVQ